MSESKEEKKAKAGSDTESVKPSKHDLNYTSKKDGFPIKKVIVHPLVLLSVVDHFNREGKIGNQKRVVGILLGAMKNKGVLDVSNSFAGKTK
jgi:26S proteasome non-ATPase regulatory subunit 7